MKPIYVDNLRKLPLDERSNLLLTQPESQWFERKGVNLRPADIARPVIAIANAEGGSLIIGVSNSQVKGLKHKPSAENDFRQAIHDYVKPHIRFPIEKVKVINSDGENDEVLFITINPADIVYEDHRGKAYLRVGDGSRELNYSERQELEYNKGVRQYDGEIIKDSNLSDLNTELVSEYADKVGYVGEAPSDVLEARFLVSENREQTNACHLLFSQHPQDIFPQASLRITKFLSDERGTGAHLNIDASNDYRLDGNIPYLVRESTKIIERIITKRKALGTNGEFIFQDIIPHDAWLEGVVNALIHRSYSFSGDYIHVELYPTRVEVTSPGIFPGLAKVDDLMHISRFARNPRIARVCTEFGFGQELGEGIKRIVEQMRSYGYIDPIYTIGRGNVRLRLEAIMRLDDKLLRELPTKSEGVLNIIRLHPHGIGTGEIMGNLDMTRPTVNTRLKRLEDVGLIRREGKTPTDPRAVWVVNEGF
jgi:ATP-dependent DNA helicase RecG